MEKKVKKSVDKKGKKWYNNQAAQESADGSLKIEQQEISTKQGLGEESPDQIVWNTDLAILKENTTQTKVKRANQAR